MHRIVWILATVALCARALGGDADSHGRCMDRLDTTQAAIGGARLPELHYECLLLANGRALWVGDSGISAKDTVLLVHGLGDNAHRDWRNVVPKLVEEFRVIALDLPGFGASEMSADAITFEALAATLDELLRRRQVERAHVVGHSLGAALSLHFAWTHPQRVDRLVLVDVAGILQESVYVRHLAQFGAETSAFRRAVSGLTVNLMRKVDGKLEPTAWLARNSTIRASLFGDSPQIDAALNLIQQNFAPAIRATQAPTTIIWGRDDAIAPLRTGLLLASRMQHARLHVLDDVGHVPMSAAPREFNALLRSALQDPIAKQAPTVVATESQGDVICKSQNNLRYTGTFNSLRLVNCANVLLEDAVLGRLVIAESTAELRNVSVDSKVALVAKGSVIVGTNVQLRGVIAIRADSSELDLAGASLQASRKALHLSSSARVYLSVSDIRSPSYTGDAHGVYTRGTRNQ